ncbi:alpha/beta hydrolase fold domain-containing protein [Arthrobacter sp. H35-D1]|uniref:alpha/beta hydrolase fold domain-containing protein n=1 Tax=Arthrobacter sp. H35-D1 TaxID=3046202 RepID=UPI0024B93711|nr:alpha/beta hydrolase fold domain-containing protein [Arthrobacter sp. H35-D1]MDJ0312736.1 alpha/beta hydrolase fold domain-containing protein [Arthrobacter sp. H35-D1]
MLLPDRLIPALLRAGKANAAFVTEAGARAQLRERTLRPRPYGPPRRIRADVLVSATRNEAGWPSYSVTPRNTTARGAVVYIHGGGWVNEIAPQHWQLAAQIAAEAKTTVQILIYPLVPYGTAQEVVDGVAAAALFSTRTHGPTVLAGDSAGGQIVLSAVLQLRDRHGVTLPRTIAISPAVDLSMKNPDIPVVQPSDPWLGTKGTQLFIDLWKDTLDVNDPVVSPLNGALEGLGPLTLFSGTRDILNPDGRLFAEKAAKAGVDVEFIQLDGQLHVFPLLPTRIGRDARKGISELVQVAITAGTP